jgi:DNA mismatch repair protein MutS2
MAIAPKTLADLAWPALCAELGRRTHSAAGERLAQALVPADDVAIARTRVSEVAEARLLRALEEPAPFGGIEDVAPEVERAARAGLLEPAALLAVADTLIAASRLRRHLTGRQASCPLLAARTVRLHELAHVAGPIRDSFDEGGRLADHASPALGGLRRRAAALRDELQRKLDALLTAPDIAPYLQDRFYTQRDERFVVPVRNDRRANVRGIVHGISASGATVFIEPEPVVRVSNDLKLAELEVREEEQRILAELSGLVRDEADLIRTTLGELAALDLVDAAAALGDDLDASAPEVGATVLGLESARHPLMVLAGRECVPNRLELAPGGVLVVSGPNAGGKTVALKTCGLLVLMAAAGLHVPANAGSRVPFYTAVLTDMGDEQSLERNLSTFSAHVLNLKRFLAAADPATLVLLDEIAVGTDPAQGGALGEATLTALADRGATVLVTTHYERLKALPARDPRFVNAAVGFDLEALRPTFRLLLGVPGSSGAFDLARRMGLDAEVVARAEALLGSREAGLEDLLRRLAEQERRLELEQAAAQRERQRLRAAVEEAEARAQALAGREQDLRARGHTEAVAVLRKARDELGAARTLLRRGPTPERVERAARTIDAAAQVIAAEAPRTAAPAGRPARPEDLVVGARVLIPRLGGEGRVAAPPERGRVAVQMGALRTQVDLGDLQIPPGGGPAGRATGVKRRRGGGATPAPEPPAAPAAREPSAIADPDHTVLRSVDNTLDLRGERVDDAIRMVEKFIDEALRADRAVVFLLHGHGTGVLRAALREHLAGLPSVLSLRPGVPEEGGDAVTVVEVG